MKKVKYYNSYAMLYMLTLMLGVNMAPGSFASQRTLLVHDSGRNLEQDLEGFDETRSWSNSTAVSHISDAFLPYTTGASPVGTRDPFGPIPGIATGREDRRNTWPPHTLSRTPQPEAYRHQPQIHTARPRRLTSSGQILPISTQELQNMVFMPAARGESHGTWMTRENPTPLPAQVDLRPVVPTPPVAAPVTVVPAYQAAAPRVVEVTYTPFAPAQPGAQSQYQTTYPQARQHPQYNYFAQGPAPVTEAAPQPSTPHPNAGIATVPNLAIQQNLQTPAATPPSAPVEQVAGNSPQGQVEDVFKMRDDAKVKYDKAVEELNKQKAVLETLKQYQNNKNISDQEETNIRILEGTIRDLIQEEKAQVRAIQTQQGNIQKTSNALRTMIADLERSFFENQLSMQAAMPISDSPALMIEHEQAQEINIDVNLEPQTPVEEGINYIYNPEVGQLSVELDELHTELARMEAKLSRIGSEKASREAELQKRTDTKDVVDKINRDIPVKLNNMRYAHASSLHENIGQKIKDQAEVVETINKDIHGENGLESKYNETWWRATGQNISDVWKGVSSAAETALDVGLRAWNWVVDTKKYFQGESGKVGEASAKRLVKNWKDGRETRNWLCDGIKKTPGSILSLFGSCNGEDFEEKYQEEVVSQDLGQMVHHLSQKHNFGQQPAQAAPQHLVQQAAAAMVYQTPAYTPAPGYSYGQYSPAPAAPFGAQPVSVAVAPPVYLPPIVVPARR